jgi:hypothetical protein
MAACIIKNGVLLIAKGCDGMVSECHPIDGVARPSIGNRNGHWLVWLTGKMCRKIVRLISKCRKGARLLNILLVRSCKSIRILKKASLSGIRTPSRILLFKFWFVLISFLNFLPIACTVFLK